MDRTAANGALVQVIQRANHRSFGAVRLTVKPELLARGACKIGIGALSRAGDILTNPGIIDR